MTVIYLLAMKHIQLLKENCFASRSPYYDGNNEE